MKAAKEGKLNAAGSKRVATADGIIPSAGREFAAADGWYGILKNGPPRLPCPTYIEIRGAYNICRPKTLAQDIPEVNQFWLTALRKILLGEDTIVADRASPYADEASLTIHNIRLR